MKRLSVFSTAGDNKEINNNLYICNSLYRLCRILSVVNSQ